MRSSEIDSILAESAALLDRQFGRIPEFTPEVDEQAVRRILLDVAKRMGNNYPYPHPLYAGQMIKPPHPVARLAYALAMHLNPNNHALDGSRASSPMEKEAVAEIARMFGWKTHLGHLCGGGTMANLEALWVARELTAGAGIAASAQAHYTHRRLSGLLNAPFHEVSVDSQARMDVEILESLLSTNPIGTVVATVGTTAVGSVDPLPAILDLRARYGFRLHADAAYGGYFTLIDGLRPETQAAYDRLGEVDSIVIDPHKHGLQPYGCGCVLFKDPAAGQVYKHESPYTYFTSNELHLGEISLECSRPGASAVALWATQKLLPLTTGGEFAEGLSACRKTALDFYRRLQSDPRFMIAFPPELDIVVWTVRGNAASESSELARAVFDEAAQRDLHLALASLPRSLLEPHWAIDWDQPQITCLRSCLMKPEHAAWLDEIWSRLGAAVTAALDSR